MKIWLTILLVLIAQVSSNLQEQYLGKKMGCYWSLEIPELQNGEQKEGKDKSEQKQKYPLEKVSQKGDRIRLEDYLSFREGQCIILFYDDKATDILSKPKINQLFIRLFHPKFIDGLVIQLFVSLNRSFDPQRQIWETDRYIQEKEEKKQNNKQEHIPQKEHIPRQMSSQENATYYIFSQFKKIATNESTLVQYKIIHNNAKFKLQNVILNIDFGPIEHSMIFPAILIVYNLVLIGLTFKVSRSNIVSQKISLISLYHSVTFMFFVSILQMLVGIDQIYNNYRWLIVSGLLTTLLGIRMIKIFQNAARRMLGIRPYFIFYLCLLGYVWIIIGYSNSVWFMIFNSLGLIPQIIHNMRYGNRLGREPSYIILIISNQFYAIYLVSCVNNVFRFQPKMTALIVIIMLLIVQIGVVIGQNMLGSWFMIPKRFIKGYHNYFLDIEVGGAEGEEQCAICLGTLGGNPCSLQQIVIEEVCEERSVKGMISKRCIMKTPCAHKFHKECLSEWMEYKLQCPVDRSVLPPVI